LQLDDDLMSMLGPAPAGPPSLRLDSSSAEASQGGAVPFLELEFSGEGMSSSDIGATLDALIETGQGRDEELDDPSQVEGDRRPTEPPAEDEGVADSSGLRVSPSSPSARPSWADGATPTAARQSPTMTPQGPTASPAAESPKAAPDDIAASSAEPPPMAASPSALPASPSPVALAVAVPSPLAVGPPFVETPMAAPGDVELSTSEAPAATADTLASWPPAGALAPASPARAATSAPPTASNLPAARLPAPEMPPQASLAQSGSPPHADGSLSPARESAAPVAVPSQAEHVRADVADVAEAESLIEAGEFRATLARCIELGADDYSEADEEANDSVEVVATRPAPCILVREDSAPSEKALKPEVPSSSADAAGDGVAHRTWEHASIEPEPKRRRMQEPMGTEAAPESKVAAEPKLKRRRVANADAEVAPEVRHALEQEPDILHSASALADERPDGTLCGGEELTQADRVRALRFVVAQLVEGIFERHEPSKAGTARRVVDKYRGSEVALLWAAVRKYVFREGARLRQRPRRCAGCRTAVPSPRPAAGIQAERQELEMLLEGLPGGGRRRLPLVGCVEAFFRELWGIVEHCALDPRIAPPTPLRQSGAKAVSGEASPAASLSPAAARTSSRSTAGGASPPPKVGDESLLSVIVAWLQAFED